MNINITKNFSTRDELDSYVKSRFGDDASKNLDVTLELTPEEMDKLSLDESTTVHGAKVVPVVNDDEVKVPRFLGSRIVNNKLSALSKKKK